MDNYYLEQRGGRIHCLQWGDGERLLLALHGFADRARLFAVLAPVLSKHYTIVAIDLPFHGQTEWPHETFSKADLLGIVAQIRLRSRCERLSLMGFSFGGRLVQAMLPDLLPGVDRVFLLAPDGIRTQGMELALLAPMWLRRRLMRAAEVPAPFLRAIAQGRQWGLVPPLIAQFLRFNLARPERRRRLFGCWLALNSFHLRRSEMRRLWAQAGIPVDIFIGTQDDIVHGKTLQRLTRGLPNVRIHRLQAGHRVVSEALAQQLQALLP